MHTSPLSLPPVTTQVVLDLLVLSDRYEFESLKLSVESLLCEQMAPSNVLQLMSYGDMYGAQTLYQHCSSYVDSNASLILHSPSLLILPKNNLKVSHRY